MTGPTIGGARVVTADDVCTAAEAILVEHLPGWAVAAGLGTITTWQQVPTVAAMTSASFPAGAITSPGLVSPPTKRREAYEATWRLAVAVYDRGNDHADTARRVRRWAALVRTVIAQHQRLAGLALRTTWVGEEYALLPDQGSARTLGGCAVTFDVVIDDVVPADAPPALGGPPADPTVVTTLSAVLVRPPTTPQE